MTTKDDNPSIYREYFQRTQEHIAKYGSKTIVLMQVGAFFEVYGLLRNDGGACSQFHPNRSETYSGSRIDEFARVCNLSISEKKITYDNGSVVMAGFRDYTLDKYIPKLTDDGFTIAVFVQETDPTSNTKPTIRRVLHAVYSPGTLLSYETETSTQITNHIMCVWMDVYMPLLQKTMSPVQTKTRETIVYGIAVANIFTGKTAIFEHQLPFHITPTTFDELERYMSVYSPSELIVVSPFDTPVVERILQFSGVQTSTIHTMDTRNPANERVQNCTKQKYIRHIFSSFFNEETYDICSEFQTYPIATQAFCFLTDFIQEHNPNLVHNIELPIFNNTSSRMLLANHTLKQLNIIDNTESATKGQYSSVAKFLNKCITPIGRRQLYSTLVNPVFDTEWLEREYSIMDYMLQPTQYTLVESFRRTMRDICDIEKIMRQLMVRKVYPSTIYKLWRSIRVIQQLNVCLFEHPVVCEYLCATFRDKMGAASAYSFMEHTTTTIYEYIERVLSISQCESCQGYETNIIRPGVSLLLDERLRKQTANLDLFREIREFLNDVIRSEEKNADLEYVKIHETEKSGMSLQITKKRGAILKKYFGETNAATITLPKSGKQIPVQDIRFSSASSTADEIVFPLLTDVCRDILTAKQQLSEIVENVYMDFLKHFGNSCYSLLDFASSYIAKLDILTTKVYLAKTYNYCRPVLSSAPDPTFTCEDESSPVNATSGACSEFLTSSLRGSCAHAAESFVHAVGLRHCLIEHIQQNEIYVANDIHLGGNSGVHKDDGAKNERRLTSYPWNAAAGACSGVLLYGTNAVGKTSFIRALGIAVILAQSGMFVPCSQFVYKPYTAIFSRILGNDNLFRGLSTFAVEMTELRMILKMSDARSLVLGDELCSGTETESALSIFMAGLCDLNQKGSSFVFATHFHEILKMDEMSQLTRVVVKHMAVHYDRELDCLVYDRKLADGSGTRMYGLEVCKSLHLPPDFLEKAYEIRAKYFPENKSELQHSPAKTYNANKIRGKCEICKTELAEETHHLQEQHLANADGYIDGFHKNHAANLMSLCTKCHDLVHCEDAAAPAKSLDDPPAELATINILSQPIPKRETKRVVRKKTTKGYSVFVENELKSL